jgi:aminopeptidase 2
VRKISSLGLETDKGTNQFEPTAARKAFPCFDEPSLKATFDIALITRKGTVALSNTQVIETRPSDGLVAQPDTPPLKQQSERGPKTESSSGEEWVLTKYATTPRVSTYLVAFANGDFEYIESSFTSPLTGGKVPLRVYATKDVIHQVSPAAE